MVQADVEPDPAEEEPAHNDGNGAGTMKVVALEQGRRCELPRCAIAGPKSSSEAVQAFADFRWEWALVVAMVAGMCGGFEGQRN